MGGILVGEPCVDGLKRYLDIATVLPAKYAREEKSSITFTHETWNYLAREVEMGSPGKRIVGWYHTHPGFSTFMSGEDRFIHENYFDRPYHVAVVLDPVSKEQQVYRFEGKGYGEFDTLYVYFDPGNEAELRQAALYYYPGEPARAAQGAFERLFRTNRKAQAKRLALLFDNAKSSNLPTSLLVEAAGFAESLSPGKS